MDTQSLAKQSKNILDPVKIVSVLDLKNGDYVADFGSGHGYFITPLAKTVTPNGKVFAIDIQRQMLDVVRAASKLNNTQNVECIWADLEQSQGSKLKDDFVDLVLVTHILHQAANKTRIIAEAYRVLRSSGRLVLIEWIANDTKASFGPPRHLRIDKQTAIDLCISQSFVIRQEFDADNHHYGIIFVKS